MDICQELDGSYVTRRIVFNNKLDLRPSASQGQTRCAWWISRFSSQYLKHDVDEPPYGNTHRQWSVLYCSILITRRSGQYPYSCPRTVLTETKGFTWRTISLHGNPVHTLHNLHTHIHSILTKFLNAIQHQPCITSRPSCGQTYFVISCPFRLTAISESLTHMIGILDRLRATRHRNALIHRGTAQNSELNRKQKSVLS